MDFRIKSLVRLLLAAWVLSQSLKPAFADRKWNQANNPNNFDPNFTTQFNRLVPHVRGDASKNPDGTPNRLGWADSYWPLNRGLIADRWQVPEAKFKFKSYPLLIGGLERIQAASQTEIDLLSPAEKFDIIREKYDFPLFKSLAKTIEPQPKHWWKGLCDGWTTAALHVPEPHAIVFRGKNSVSVPLGSSDIKGLLSFYFAKRHDSSVSYVGKSCRISKKFMLGIDGSCQDINAGAFHVVLINQIGLHRRGFAMDRDGGLQVWNHPILAYETEYRPLAGRSSKASAAAQQEIAVKTTIYYPNELYNSDQESEENDFHSAPSYLPVIETTKQKMLSKTYDYIIELDAHQNIIGGEWTGGDAPPDLIWKQEFSLPSPSEATARDADDWSILQAIIQQATAP